PRATDKINKATKPAGCTAVMTAATGGATPPRHPIQTSITRVSSRFASGSTNDEATMATRAARLSLERRRTTTCGRARTGYVYQTFGRPTRIAAGPASGAMRARATHPDAEQARDGGLTQNGALGTLRTQ